MAECSNLHGPCGDMMLLRCIAFWLIILRMQNYFLEKATESGEKAVKSGEQAVKSGEKAALKAALNRAGLPLFRSAK